MLDDHPLLAVGVTRDASAGPTVSPAAAVTFWQTIVPTIDAFLLGWRITELKSRIAIAAALTKAEPPPERTDQPVIEPSAADAETDGPTRADLGDPVWMASVWRAAFKQVVAAHAKEFPDVSTAGTLYEPPGGWANEKLISYLYPAPGGDGMTDYTGVGLIPTPGEDAPFSIQGVTRRALNALIILYATSGDALIADTIRRYQGALLQAMGYPADDASVFETKRRAGVADLSARTQQLLEGWDGFLHEQYYANATQSPDRATKLMAFEAGRALATLTWSISVHTVVLESAPTEGPAAAQALLQQWHDVFNAYDVGRAQHFVSALGSALDNAYGAYLGAPAARSPSASPDAPPSPPFDHSAPSNICRAITDGLDHWLGALTWLQGLQDQGTAPPGAFFRRLRVALIAQSDLWLSLLVTNQTLRSFTLESVMNQMVQNVLLEIEDQFVQQTGEAIRRGFRGFLGAVPPLAWAILGGCGLLVAVAVIWLWVAHPILTTLNPNGLWAVLGLGGLGPALAALFGVRAAGAPPPSGATAAASPPSASMERANGVLKMIESSASESFRAAYAQVRQELAAFNHSIGVAYPLIECFVLDNSFPAVTKIQSAYAFIATVIWTSDERRQEIEDIVRAALGPISLLSGGHAQSDG